MFIDAHGEGHPCQENSFWTCLPSRSQRLWQYVYKIPVVVIKVQIKGVKVLEGGQGVDVQLKAHVLEHKVQPHLLQLVILVRLESDFS